MKTLETKHVLEAALLSADEPLSLNDLKRLFEQNDNVTPKVIEAALTELADDMDQRPIRLVQVANGWRFQTRPEFAKYIERLSPEKAPKYSRAVMETLAIVAYRQPVTRGDIEEIRGVSVSAQIVKTLEDRGWIDVIGHKEVLGRPALFGTTNQFLDDLGLKSLNELPSIDDLAQNDASVEMLTQKLVELSKPPSDPAVAVVVEDGVTNDFGDLGDSSENAGDADIGGSAESADSAGTVEQCDAGAQNTVDASDKLLQPESTMAELEGVDADGPQVNTTSEPVGDDPSPDKR
ncbi:MAG: SMC-Scp complex subunit ScpB [Burkholderiaceae bacterium]